MVCSYVMVLDNRCIAVSYVPPIYRPFLLSASTDPYSVERERTIDEKSNETTTFYRQLTPYWTFRRSWYDFAREDKAKKHRITKNVFVARFLLHRIEFQSIGSDTNERSRQPTILYAKIRGKRGIRVFYFYCAEKYTRHINIGDKFSRYLRTRNNNPSSIVRRSFGSTFKLTSVRKLCSTFSTLFRSLYFE